MPDAATSGNGRESKGRGRKSGVVTSLFEMDKFRKGTVSVKEDGRKRQRAADCQSDDTNMEELIEPPVCMECGNKKFPGYYASFVPTSEQVSQAPRRKNWGTCCKACTQRAESKRSGYLSDLV